VVLKSYDVIGLRNRYLLSGKKTCTPMTGIRIIDN